MKDFFLLFLLLLCPMPRASAYNRDHLNRLLQEQSYTELLAVAAAEPEGGQDIYLLNTAGYAAYQNGRADLAMAYFRRALGTDSSNIQALLYLGLISKQSSCQAALPYFLHLCLLRPSNARYLRLAADCYADLKQPDSAYRYTAVAYEAAPEEPAIAYAYADALLERKRFGRADSVLRRALLAAPGQVQLLSASVRSAYLQKRYAQVLLLEDTLILAGHISYVPLLYGMLAALQQKRYPECIRYYQLLQAAGRETEQVLYYASKAYSGMKQYAQSNELLRQCMETAISENAAAYYTEAGENMLAMKKYRPAQLYYDTARYLSGDPVLLYRKGLAYDAAGQSRQAQGVYKAFVKAPGNADSAYVHYAESRIGSIGK